MWAADWPGVKFTEVRAFYYNDAGAFDIPILKNGRLNPGVENPEGNLLSKEQADRLLQILNTKRFEATEPGCFVPRHAFVFFDEQKHAVATYEVCIHCHSQLGSPAGLAPVTDFDAIVALIDELKLRLEPSYLKKGSWREEWEPSKLVPFDEKKATAAPRPEPPKPVVHEVSASKVRGHDYPAKRFSPWVEKDARHYAGSYNSSDGDDDAALTQTIRLKVTSSGEQWMVNGTTQLSAGRKALGPEQKGQIWDEPLRIGKIVSFSQNGLYSYIFCRFQRDNGKVVNGLVILERFYEKQK